MYLTRHYKLEHTNDAPLRFEILGKMLSLGTVEEGEWAHLIDRPF